MTSRRLRIQPWCHYTFDQEANVFIAMKSHLEPEIPLAHAVPITQLPSAPSGTVEVEVKVPLPLHASSGFSFEHDPPRVSGVVNDAHQRLLGYYFNKLALPGLEIWGVFDCNVLRKLLMENEHVERTLILTDTPPKRGEILYQYTLPREVGLTFSGFPPCVQSINDKFLFGRVRVGQAVHALCIPGRAPFMMQSGGFTAVRLQQQIEETSHIDGRQLILKDKKEELKTRAGSRGAFDPEGCCVS
ncbi:hypothetical protein FisN_15Hh241 [Fistulifera solaris]|uniref:Uncharacterized protein n=1 Tax=Fistulifera solaris TaxID=1519565 RepID=A0A1Z5JFU1_FISSO|nr:hypothetical protein FisN_15Hh241 [Fistulifera solaris]|eukprot:GAX12762.1 hypothetical protein FisN_15Hh241 [Fistulifera solaris]